MAFSSFPSGLNEGLYDKVSKPLTSEQPVQEQMETKTPKTRQSHINMTTGH